jgi:predicted RNA binding protein YcfA (HicA-like mRNA interferase family)
MPALPVISGQECISALAEVGYHTLRQRGSHVRLVCEGRPPITVPLHRTLDRGTLRAIIRAVDMSTIEFVDLLNR